MTIPSEHHDVQELLGAYAIHALDDDERLEVEHHLKSCPICREEVDADFEVAAAMALGEAVEPLPPGLWRRIAGTLPPPPTGLRTPEGSRRTPERHLRRRGRLRRIVAVGAVAAAAAAICVLAVSLASTNQQLSQARHALGSSVDAYQHALTVPGHRALTLRTPSGDAIADVVVDPGGRGYLITPRTPVLSKDRTFQLWAVVRGKPISIGLFGNHPTAVAFELGSAPATELAMTVEPEGGSVTPTYPILASGAL